MNKLLYPDDMLRTFAKSKCKRCGGSGIFQAETTTHYIRMECRCALKNIQRRAQKLNKYADMLNTQEN